MTTQSDNQPEVNGSSDPTADATAPAPAPPTATETPAPEAAPPPTQPEPSPAAAQPQAESESPPAEPAPEEPTPRMEVLARSIGRNFVAHLGRRVDSLYERRVIDDKIKAELQADLAKIEIVFADLDDEGNIRRPLKVADDIAAYERLAKSMPRPTPPAPVLRRQTYNPQKPISSVLGDALGLSSAQEEVSIHPDAQQTNEPDPPNDDDAA